MRERERERKKQQTERKRTRKYARTYAHKHARWPVPCINIEIIFLKNVKQRRKTLFWGDVYGSQYFGHHAMKHSWKKFNPNVLSLNDKTRLRHSLFLPPYLGEYFYDETNDTFTSRRKRFSDPKYSWWYGLCRLAGRLFVCGKLYSSISSQRCSVQWCTSPAFLTPHR